MAIEGGFVGGVELPVAAGTHKQRLADPVVDAILELAAFWIKRDLDAKLANLAQTGVDAVPESNRFAFDPLTPRGHSVKMPTPSLFVWWDGSSRWSKQTALYHVRERDISMLYVFQELPQFEEMERRAGLMNAVDASMFAMAHRQVSDDHNSGVWINETMTTDLNLLSWQWMGGKPGRFGIDEGPLAERRAAKKSGRDFPALIGKWMVQERVELRATETPADLLGDVQMDIGASDGESGTTEDFMTRYLT